MGERAHPEARTAAPHPVGVGRVLVGIDFRQRSLVAARWAAAHFRGPVDLELMHVVEVPDVPAFLRPLMPALDDRLATAAVAPLEQLRELSDSLDGVPVSFQVRVGSRVHQLVQRAHSTSADLVVLGRDSLQGSRGRTLERLIRHLDVPALIVCGNRLAETPRSVLVAVDEAPIGRSVAAWGMHMAERFGAEATLLHVLSEGLLPHITDRAARLTHEWLASVAPESRITPHTSVATGVPGSVILDTARATDADLIVIGRNGHEAAGPAEIGSAARLLLLASHVPVLIVPPARSG